MNDKQPSKKVELLRQHEHAGRSYPKGAELTLREDKAEWLIGIKAAKEVSRAAAPAQGAGPGA